MDYLLLKTFLTVIDTGSFSKAANTLNCVQSNITARIKRLETQFEQTLFERHKSGVRTTDFGRELEQQALRLVSAHEQAERELMDVAGKSAKLRLGSMETTAGARLPALLKWLADEYPAAQMSLYPAPTGDLTAMVWERQLDAAFVAGPIDAKRFHNVAAFDEQLMLATPTHSREGLPLLAFRAACSYRHIANEWLRIQGMSDTNIIEMGTLDGMLGCVEAGMGFAIFPHSALKTYRHFVNITFTALDAPLANTTTYLIWRNDHSPCQVHSALIERLQADKKNAPTV